MNKAIYEKKQLQNPANPGFFKLARRRRRKILEVFPPIFWTLGGKTLFSPHFPDPGGKIEKAVSPHYGGKKDTPDQILPRGKILKLFRSPGTRGDILKEYVSWISVDCFCRP